MKIVLCYPVESRHVQQIRAAAPGDQVLDAGQERIAALLPEADIFCGHAKVTVPWPEVVARGRLQWIQSSAAGLDHCLVPSVIDSPIPVTSASGLFANQVAEQTMAILLGLIRSLPTFLAAQQRKEFVRRPTRDLHGRTAGIVGFGGNGRRIAEILAPFRTRILATDMFPVDRPDFVAHLWSADRLDTLLQQSDIVILCVPLNEHTRGMISARQLARMPAGSMLINVARGPVVVEEDLIDALRSRRLSAAGLDVTEIEPLPETSPLWEMSNVIITPHVGAQSADRVDLTTDFFCENLKRFREGKPLLNLVDKRLGFPSAQARRRVSRLGRFLQDVKNRIQGNGFDVGWQDRSLGGPSRFHPRRPAQKLRRMLVVIVPGRVSRQLPIMT